MGACGNDHKVSGVPGDMWAEVPVNAGALYADEDPVGQRGPARVRAPALSTTTHLAEFLDYSSRIFI